MAHVAANFAEGNSLLSMTSDDQPQPIEDSEGDQSVVSDSQVRDTLPADLDPSTLTATYLFPNNSRRRIPAIIYSLMGIAAIVLWITADSGAVLVNNGILIAGIALVAIGAYHWQAGWDLSFDEQHALGAATREVGFPVGHASAQLGWRGLRSRPTWRILLYSNEPSPTRRGLVLVDGIDGEIIDRFVEDNPEDWAAYGN